MAVRSMRVASSSTVRRHLDQKGLAKLLPNNLACVGVNRFDKLSGLLVIPLGGEPIKLVLVTKKQFWYIIRTKPLTEGRYVTAFVWFMRA